MRAWQARREEAARVSWLARTLSQYIAAGYMTDGKRPNTALESAAVLGYDDIERAIMTSPAVTQAPKENKKGSFEKLTSFLGRGGLIGKRK